MVAAESAYDPSGRDPSLSEPVRVLPDLPISLCTHGILRRKNDPADLFIVPDVTKDWRFAKNVSTLGTASAHPVSSIVNASTTDSLKQYPKGERWVITCPRTFCYRFLPRRLRHRLLQTLRVSCRSGQFVCSGRSRLTSTRSQSQIDYSSRSAQT